MLGAAPYNLTAVGIQNLKMEPRVGVMSWVGVIIIGFNISRHLVVDSSLEAIHLHIIQAGLVQRNLDIVANYFTIRAFIMEIVFYFADDNNRTTILCFYYSSIVPLECGT